MNERVCESSSHMEREVLASGKNKNTYDNPGQHIKKQRHHFADKGPSSQIYVFSSSHVGMVRAGQ